MMMLMMVAAAVVVVTYGRSGRSSLVHIVLAALTHESPVRMSLGAWVNVHVLHVL
jgi:hypothetical protein